MIVVDNGYKKNDRVQVWWIIKWLEDLLKYYDAKDVQSNLKKLRKYWVNLMLIKNYSVYMNNFLKKTLYFDTSALLKDFANKIDSCVLKITSSTTNDIQIIS